MLDQINKLEIGAGVLELYPRMNYTFPLAMAELVDNSIHAYYLNVENLELDCRISIDISNNSTDKFIRITDNCGGMTEEDIKRLVKLGIPKPEEDRGKYALSKYGIGLKSSSLWLGRKVIIKTKHYSGNYPGYQLIIDLDLANTSRYVTISELQEFGKGITQIEIRNLNRRLTTSILNKTREGLSAIYSFYLKEGVQISFDDSELRSNNAERECLLDPNGNPRYDKYQLEYEGRKFEVEIMALLEGSTFETGVNLYFNKRQMRGFPISPNYRPKELASWTGDTVQRLICNIDVSDCTPTHSKDDITEDDDFREGLFNEIRNRSWDIIRAASDGLREQKNKEQEKKNVGEYTQKAYKTIDDKKIVDPTPINITQQEDPEFTHLPEHIRIKQANDLPVYSGIFEHDNISAEYSVYLSTLEPTEVGASQVICEKEESGKWRITIMLNSPYRNFVDEIENYIIVTALEALTELYLIESDKIHSYNPLLLSRIFFNLFLQNYYSSLSDNIFEN